MRTLAKVLLATTTIAAGAAGAVALGSAGVTVMSALFIVHGIAVPVEAALIAAGLAPSTAALYFFFDERRQRFSHLVETYELQRLDRMENERQRTLRY